jgi:signal transduction histidine kinase
LYFAHALVVGCAGTSFRNSLLLAGVPSVVGLGFALAGQPYGAVVSVIAAAVGVALYRLGARSIDELEALRRREAELKGRLAELRVAQERGRIARDLHDGVGAQLAGLIWRVRGLASAPSSSPPASQTETLELDDGLDLGDVTRNEATALVQRRVEELAGRLHIASDASGGRVEVLLPIARSEGSDGSSQRDA